MLLCCGLIFFTRLRLDLKRDITSSVSNSDSDMCSTWWSYYRLLHNIKLVVVQIHFLNTITKKEHIIVDGIGIMRWAVVTCIVVGRNMQLWTSSKSWTFLERWEDVILCEKLSYKVNIPLRQRMFAIIYESDAFWSAHLVRDIWCSPFPCYRREKYVISLPSITERSYIYVSHTNRF